MAVSLTAHGHTHPPSTGTVLLEVRDLTVGYGGVALLPRVSFTIRSGEIWALFGPNGGGKSTVLRTLLNQQQALAGDVHAYAPISSVSQRSGIDPLIPGRCRDVISSGCDRGWSFLNPLHGRSQRGAFLEAARAAGVEELLDLPFQQLSEGQKQRVLIARALVSRPRLLALDEPTSAMDPFREAATFRLLRTIASERGHGVIVASHHMHFLTEVADHAVYVDRDAGVVLNGTFAEVAQRPEVIARYGDLLTHDSCHGLDAALEGLQSHEALSAQPSPGESP